MDNFDVVWPLGHRPAAVSNLDRPRTPLSEGRIAFVWDYLFHGDRMFEIIERELRELWPSLVFVDFSEFGDIHDVMPDDISGQKLQQRLTELGVTGAVVGVGA